MSSQLFSKKELKRKESAEAAAEQNLNLTFR